MATSRQRLFFFPHHQKRVGAPSSSGACFCVCCSVCLSCLDPRGFSRARLHMAVMVVWSERDERVGDEGLEPQEHAVLRLPVL